MTSTPISPPRFQKPSSEHRCNREINIPQVRLVDAEGTMLGVMPTIQALRMAQEAGLDLVEISPQAEPPLCKILDYSKFRFELHKKESEANKKQKHQQVKEVQIRPNIGAGDLDVKKRAILRFLQDESKVKIVMRFRGREIQHMDEGGKVISTLVDDLKNLATCDVHRKPDLKQIIVNISPLKGKPA